MLLDVFLLVSYALVMQHCLISGIRNDWFLQIGKKTFDQTCNKKWIFYLLQILVIPSAELLQGLIFLINRHALPKNSLLSESFRFSSEVVYQ